MIYLIPVKSVVLWILTYPVGKVRIFVFCEVQLSCVMSILSSPRV